jgi:hypothetical protein
MKKLILLGFAFTLFIASASAQSVRDGKTRAKSYNGVHDRQVTRGEKFQMHKNDFRYKKESRKYKRDGYMSRNEKRRLYKMKQQNRRDAFRYKHNGHRRSF